MLFRIRRSRAAMERMGEKRQDKDEKGESTGADPYRSGGKGSQGRSCGRAAVAATRDPIPPPPQMFR